MDCPQRPCKCDLGDPHQKALKVRIRNQEIMHNSPYMTSGKLGAFVIDDDSDIAAAQEPTATAEA